MKGDILPLYLIENKEEFALILKPTRICSSSGIHNHIAVIIPRNQHNDPDMIMIQLSLNQ